MNQEKVFALNQYESTFGPISVNSNRVSAPTSLFENDELSQSTGYYRTPVPVNRSFQYILNGNEYKRQVRLENEEIEKRKKETVHQSSPYVTQYFNRPASSLSSNLTSFSANSISLNNVTDSNQVVVIKKSMIADITEDDDSYTFTLK